MNTTSCYSSPTTAQQPRGLDSTFQFNFFFNLHSIAGLFAAARDYSFIHEDLGGGWSKLQPRHDGVSPLQEFSPASTRTCEVVGVNSNLGVAETYCRCRSLLLHPR
ncbi:MAG: hypothetical protein WBP41_17005 [Saprospiraceae bacterium]